MIFHSFFSQEERISFGGSGFIEIQFCKLPQSTSLRNILSDDSVKNWQNDSLYIYIDDENIFYKEYSHIFNCCIYNNLKKGTVDLCGINYYEPLLIDSLIQRLYNDKPKEYETVIEWLIKAKDYNGFYILGVWITNSDSLI